MTPPPAPAPVSTTRMPRTSLAVADFVHARAAAQGYANADFNLGLCHADGRGVARDDAEATRLFERAAAKGNKEAEAVLEFRLNTRGFGKKLEAYVPHNTTWHSEEADLAHFEPPPDYELPATRPG